MAMIEVQHLQKNFVKTVKEPGLKGALRSFIHPEKQTFEAVCLLYTSIAQSKVLSYSKVRIFVNKVILIIACTISR